MLKKIESTFILFLLFCVGVFLQSCEPRYAEVNKIKGTEWRPEIAAPLVNAEIEIETILARNANDAITTDADGLITLNYETDLIDFNVFDLIPPVTETFSHEVTNTLPVTTTFTFNGSLPPQSDDVPIEFPTPNGEKIREVNLKGGQLEMVIDPNFPNLTPDFDLSIELTSVLENGSPFQITEKIDPTEPKVITINLADIMLDFTLNSSVDNKFKLKYNVVLNHNAGDQISPNDGFTFSFSIKNPQLRWIKGDFKTQQIDLFRDSLNLSIFGNATSNGNFRLTDPRLNMKITNGIGIPLNLEFRHLYTKNIATGDTFPILFNGFQNPFNLNAPSQMDGQVVTNLSLNRNNTDIINILSPTPKWVVYDLGATVNPGPGPHFNFVSDESVLRAEASIELPLEGYLEKFDVQDTIDFSFGETIEELANVRLNLLITNGLPLDANLQIYLYNEQNGIIDSIFTNETSQIFRSSTPNAQGRIIQSEVEPYQLLIDLDEDLANNMIASEKLIVDGNLETYDAPNTNIKLYNDYALGIKMGLLVEGSINVNPN